MIIISETWQGKNIRGPGHTGVRMTQHQSLQGHIRGEPSTWVSLTSIYCLIHCRHVELIHYSIIVTNWSVSYISNVWTGGVDQKYITSINQILWKYLYVYQGDQGILTKYGQAWLINHWSAKIWEIKILSP